MSEDELADLMELAFEETETERKEEKSTSRKSKSTSRRSAKSTSRSTSRKIRTEDIEKAVRSYLEENKEKIVESLLVEATSRLDKIIEERVKTTVNETVNKIISTSSSTSRNQVGIDPESLKKEVRSVLLDVLSTSSSTSRSKDSRELREALVDFIIDVLVKQGYVFRTVVRKRKGSSKPKIKITEKDIDFILPYLKEFSFNKKKKRKSGPRHFVPIEFWNFLNEKGVDKSLEWVRAVIRAMRKRGILKGGYRSNESRYHLSEEYVDKI